MRKRFAVAGAIAGLIVSISMAPGQRGDDKTAARDRLPAPATTTTRHAPEARVLAAAQTTVSLDVFSSCGDFLRHVRARAAKIVGPSGLDTDVTWFEGPVAAASDGAGAAMSGPQAPMPMMAPGVPPHAFSGTNVQVAGVDEPDIVKTDGRAIFWLGERTLHAVAIGDDGSMRDGDVLRLRGWDHSMLLAGGRALIFANTWRAQGLRPGGITRVTVVDVTDHDDLRVVSETDFEGDFVSARLIDGTARIVIRSHQPNNLRFSGPIGWTGPDVTAAIKHNKRLIKRSPADVWLPRVAVGSEDERTVRPLVGCSNVYTPKTFSGLDIVSIVTMDPADPAAHHSTSVLGGGETVYATADRLFVATTRFVPTSVQRGFDEVWTTQIHSFDISDPSGALYRASGEVDGQLKDQWALDLHEGHLRVATTLGVPWEESSESAVTILREHDGVLEEVGRVGDLGDLGEQIYAVRFMGDVGYVVTFRLIDPLYTIDLSDPAAPRVMGELKIPGYSAYLHPIEDGLLLGIGQDATRRGVTRGTQISLFDVSDLSDPRRIDQLSFRSGSSEAEDDHHAFLFWPATGSLVVPLNEYGEKTFVGAVGVRVKDRRLSEIARVSHQRGMLEQIVLETWRASIRRSLVVGDTLYTLSGQGMLASDLETFAERDWLGWGAPLDRVAGWVGGDAGLRDGWGSGARFREPGQIALGYGGEVWIADTGNAAVRKVEWGHASTPSVVDADGNEGFPGAPVGIAPDPDRGIFVATSCALWLMPPDGGHVGHVAGDCSPPRDVLGQVDGVGSSARFGSIGHIARASDGSIMVVDTGAHAIRRVTVDSEGVGTVTTVAGSLGRPGYADGPASQARFSEPTGITVLPSGDVVVADTGNHVVRRLEPGSWRVVTIAGSPGRPSGSARDARLSAPRALAYDAVTERLYVTEAGAHRVASVEGRTIARVAGDGTAGLRRGDARYARFRSPGGMIVMGSALLVADTGNHRLRWIR